MRLPCYSLGITMYEMVAGKRPFEGDSVEDIRQQHLHQSPLPPSRYAALPQALELIILKCLEKNPSQRFQSMDELGIALTQIIHDQPPVDLVPLLKIVIGELNNDIQSGEGITVPSLLPPLNSTIGVPPTVGSPPDTIAPLMLPPVTHVPFPYLRILKGASKVRAIFPLKNDQIRLGRSNESEIILDSNKISRFHARIVIENGKYYLEDFNSISGTMVNGNRIRGKQLLQDSDTIQIADFVLEFKQSS